jgi:hypothetical protein
VRNAGIIENFPRIIRTAAWSWNSKRSMNRYAELLLGGDILATNDFDAAGSFAFTN